MDERAPPHRALPWTNRPHVPSVAGTKPPPLPTPSTPADRLATYREKRRASRTPEPFGGQVVAGGSIFVVQQHDARDLHWDLRLELDGVLLSWAVPKGPSPNQADKRLAVETEDHPLEYAEFEGVIPEGEYGAGAMIVRDKGVWVPLEDPHEGLEKGKLLFELAPVTRMDGEPPPPRRRRDAPPAAAAPRCPSSTA